MFQLISYPGQYDSWESHSQRPCQYDRMLRWKLFNTSPTLHLHHPFHQTPKGGLGQEHRHDAATATAP